jgi:drug/metabolite transporter (DMT)-like permease
VPSPPSRVIAVVQASLVCFVWSTSFVITKRLYADGVGPLTLTGLRYGLAGVVLLPLWLRRRGAAAAPGGAGRVRPRTLVLLGLAGYAISPVGYNIGLVSLDASWIGVVLGVSNTLQVLIWSGVLLREWPARTQVAAIGVAMFGIVLFEVPGGGGRGTAGPMLAVIASGTGYALWVIGNRRLMRNADPVHVACPSMLSGAVPVLAIGAVTEGWPPPTWQVWLPIVFLAVVNTAAAFTVWTHTQAVLAAYESTVINNTMTVQVAVLAYVFLGEPLGARQWIAVAVVAAATLAVQVRRRALSAPQGPAPPRRKRRPPTATPALNAAAAAPPPSAPRSRCPCLPTGDTGNRGQWRASGEADG